jgi:hypothetical protein
MLTGFPLFAKAYGWSGGEMAHAVSSTSDGGFAVIGRTSSYGAGNDDFLFIKVSSDGVLEWTRTYGGAGYDYGMQVYQTQDMGYVMFGYTSSYSSYYTLLLKTASNGALQWAKAYNIYPAWWISWEGWLDLTSDGGFIFHSGNGDIRVVKTASDGTIMWAKRIDGPNDDGPGHITETSDGGFVVVGQTASWGSGPSDFIVVKLASDGAVQWARVYGGPSYECALSVDEVADGNLVVVGYTGTFNPNDDILVLKLSSSDGGLIWGRAFDAGSNERAYDVIATDDNCVAILCSGASLLKMDLNGNLLWARRIPINGYGLTKTAGGDLAVAGYASPNNTDFALLRVGLDGNYSGCLSGWSPTMINGSVASSPITVGADITVSSIDVTPEVNTPNLVTTNICSPVDLSESWPEPAQRVICYPVSGGLAFASRKPGISLSLYSPDGRLVYSGQLREGLNRITLGRGVYLWRAGGYDGKAIVR